MTSFRASFWFESIKHCKEKHPLSLSRRDDLSAHFPRSLSLTAIYDRRKQNVFLTNLFSNDFPDAFDVALLSGVHQGRNASNGGGATVFGVASPRRCCGVRRRTSHFKASERQTPTSPLQRRRPVYVVLTTWCTGKPTRRWVLVGGCLHMTALT